VILNLTSLARQQLDAGRSHLEAAITLANDLAQVGECEEGSTALLGEATFRPSWGPGYQSTWTDAAGVGYGEADLAARAVIREARTDIDMVRAQVQHEASFNPDPCAVDDAESFLAVLDEIAPGPSETRH
jgi:hypothetical protein